MNQSNRIIINVLVTFGRMALTVGAGIAITRIVLDQLGTVDYGIFLLLGASVGFLALLGHALVASAQRHLAFELGRGDASSQRQLFTTILALFVMMALGIYIVGQALAPLILSILDIPPERTNAAWWVYQLTLISVAAHFVVAPFQAAFMARQAMVQEAILALASSYLTLAAAIWVLRGADADLLITWSLLVVGISMTLLGVKVFVALIRFPECRARWSAFHKPLIPELLSFAGWSLLGRMEYEIRVRISQFLLNINFGPRINASLGIGSQLSSYQTAFSNAFNRAVSPALTTIRGRDDGRNFLKLLYSGEKLSLLLSILFGMPVIILVEPIMKLWLTEVPEYAPTFARFLIIAGLIQLARSGHYNAVLAAGNIGRFTIIMTIGVLLPVLIAAVAFPLGAPPTALAVLFAVFALLSTLVEVAVACRLLKLRYRDWISKTVLPVAVAIVPAALLGLLVATLFETTLNYAIAFCLTFWGVGLIVALCFSLTSEEKQRLSQPIKVLLRRVRPTK
ncbi:MAG: hypothetical protein JJU36_07160 [Phycisphaeraceae bacterium]|nr:hypothetical protein [Phycisphaeraceae bacterium]